MNGKIWVEKYLWTDGSVTWNIVSRHTKYVLNFNTFEEAESRAKEIAEELDYMYDPVVEEVREIAGF